MQNRWLQADCFGSATADQNMGGQRLAWHDPTMFHERFNWNRIFNQFGASGTIPKKSFYDFNEFSRCCFGWRRIVLTWIILARHGGGWCSKSWFDANLSSCSNQLSLEALWSARITNRYKLSRIPTLFRGLPMLHSRMDISLQQLTFWCDQGKTACLW